MYSGIKRRTSSVSALASLPMLFLALCPAPSSAGDAGTGEWSTQFNTPGVDGRVTRLLPYGEDLLVAGEFGLADREHVNSVALWDGLRYRQMGEGLIHANTDGTVEPGVVWDLVEHEGSPIAAGVFDSGSTPQVGAARWNGAEWERMGSLTNSVLIDLDWYQGSLVAAAYVEALDYRVLRWTGSEWEALPGAFDGLVGALVTQGTRLVVAGDFSSVDGVACDGMARWDGTRWSAYADAPGRSGECSMVMHHGYLFYSGAAVGVWRFTGATWESCGIGARGFAILENELYALGDSYLYRWVPNTSGFEAVDEQTGLCMASYRGQQYFGGTSLRSNNTLRRMSALSSNLRPVGSGNALWYAPTDGISFNGDLFVGGVIKAYGKRTGNGFRLKWNEERWREIEGPVLQRFVPCIHRGALVSLFADGAYGSANGSSKRITGPLPPGQAAATISWNGQLVLGGRFFEVQSPVPRSMYAWDGNAWQRIGSGLREATVRTVAVVNNELYASGIIPEDESVPLSNIARWDGTQWRPLGMGLDEGASALIEFEGQLIAGGSFTKSGDQEIGHAARWDGTNWHSLGDLGQPVRCFAILDGELFAGTEGLQPYPFEQIPANVFRWTGSEWEPQSPGIYSYPRDRINSRGIRVNSLVAHEGQLWAFGTFDFVGDVPSTGVAVLSPSTGRFATGIEDARTRSALELSIAHSGAGQLAIRYALASTSPARLQVFDVAGRRRAGIELSTSARGAHDLTWRPVDGDGRALGSGIYFLRLQQDQNAATKRLVWIR